MVAADARSRAWSRSGRGVRCCVVLLGAVALSACGATGGAALSGTSPNGISRPAESVTATSGQLTPSATDAPAPPDLEPVPDASVPRSSPPASLDVGGVVAAVQLAPVASDGSLAVPDDVSELGWWIGSAPMGATVGTTLIAGHVDSAEQGLGVFAELRRLDSGDPVTVVDGLGATHRFVVTDIEEVAKVDLPEELFDTAGPRRVALVTCSGPFDERTRRYQDNLIVWAEPASGR